MLYDELVPGGTGECRRQLAFGIVVPANNGQPLSCLHERHCAQVLVRRASSAPLAIEQWHGATTVRAAEVTLVRAVVVAVYAIGRGGHAGACLPRDHVQRSRLQYPVLQCPFDVIDWLQPSAISSHSIRIGASALRRLQFQQSNCRFASDDPPPAAVGMT